jgi:hypothetical protein
VNKNYQMNDAAAMGLAVDLIGARPSSKRAGHCLIGAASDLVSDADGIHAPRLASVRLAGERAAPRN